jgi:hypothetical protein
MTDFKISKEMSELIIAYMTACNEQEYAKSEELLMKIKEQGAVEHEQRSQD